LHVAIGSDNLISMPEVTATEASRSFADLLDGVEHRGEIYTIVRRGRVVAQLEPAHAASGRDLKALLRRHRPDRQWTSEVAELRQSLTVEERF
jgi:prevent-host-death family protein